MNTPAPSPDELAAPALRRALTVERARRPALEQENARRRDALGRQNARVERLEAENQALRARGQELADQVAAVLAQVQVLAGEVAALREENAPLRGERGEEQPGAAARRPPSWAKAKTPKPAAKRERPRRAAEHNHGRRRLPAAAVTRTVEHAVDACPHCRTPLAGGRAARRVQVIDLPPPRAVEVTEHVLIERRCPGCRRRVRPAPPGDAAGRLGQCRFGPRLIAALATWRTVERLPVRQLRARLAREHGLDQSRGGVLRLLHLAARQATPAYERIRDEVRASPVMHLDETSWREDGQHGYVWVATTPDACLFHRDPSRGGQVVDVLLGARTERVFVSDFSVAYDHCLEQHQRCWPISGGTSTTSKASTPRTGRWPPGSKPSARSGTPRPAPVRRRRRATAPPPAAPATNNLAERRLRPLVIGRKISGGARSKAGSDARMVLTSVLQTALLRGEDPYQTCFAFLSTPAPPPSSDPCRGTWTLTPRSPACGARAIVLA